MSAMDDKPTHRMFSWASVLIPISLEKYAYQPGNYRLAYLYVFGVRVARWNCVN